MRSRRLLMVFAIGIASAFLLVFPIVLAKGAAKPTNKLATASSPYLREAATQPVAWYPWGEEPFRLAQALDRPILLDIGAIWCHWCHVMDEETYSNPEVAELINTHFIAIKVDRDERPDIDTRYQKAVQALTGRGGWPLTVFLTTEGQAFFGGGTFFPDDRFGRPGFKRVLPRIAEAYRQQREVLRAAAEKLTRAVAGSEAKGLRKAALSPHLIEAIAQAVTQAFDEVHGGFGRDAKFPAAGPLELAFRLYAERGDENLLRLATRTLDEMAKGGIYDQVGGGFHRYATDPAWRVPHFEKLDSVNAELLLTYLQAYQATGETRYRQVAEGILAYVDRILSDHENGGFYAHQDADMGPGDDGAYYTWTAEQVRAALSNEETEVILRLYGIIPTGEMSSGSGQHVLWMATTPEAIAEGLSLPLPRVETLIASGKAHLLEARNRRKTPRVDRTRFADRNGMMISAYFEAYKTLGRQDLKAFALKSLEFLLAHLRSKDGALFHAFSEGKPTVPGFLSDYVWVTEALLQAFQVTGETRYIGAAKRVMDEALRTFWDGEGGGLFDLRPDPAALGALKRPSKSFEDTSSRSANPMAAQVLDRLAYLTNEKGYQEQAEQLLEAFAGTAPEVGLFAASYALAVDLHLHPPAHVVIIGSQADSQTHALWRSALAAFRPGKIVVAYDPTRIKPANLTPPVAAAMRGARVGGAPQAYVCVGLTCSLPTTKTEEVTSLVRTFARQAPQERANAR